MRFNPRWIIGKTVASVDMQKIEHGASGGGPSYDPIIHFTDGSKIWFSTIEGCDPGNEYGTDIGYTQPQKQKRYRVNYRANRYRYFADLDSAKQFCDEVFSRTNIVLAIEGVE